MATYIRRDLGDLELQEWLITGTVWVINYLFYASAYYFFKSSISKQSKINHFQQEHHEQETKILQKEKDLLAMENRVLRTQINPHVLYNTLNFLYAKSLPVSEELSNGILTLSEIMQYSLKNQDSNGLVPLLDELEHIQNVISLAQLKSNGKAYINLRYEEFDETILVVPLLLITLVENIFKHGDVSDPNHPAIISLRREVGGNLNFHASNKPGKASPMPGTSLGLGNVRMRMENEYGTDGKMNVTRSESSFEVEISIPIRTTPKSNKPEPFASASAA